MSKLQERALSSKGAQLLRASAQGRMPRATVHVRQIARSHTSATLEAVILLTEGIWRHLQLAIGLNVAGLQGGLVRQLSHE